MNRHDAMRSNFLDLKAGWPLEKMRRANVYFYNKSIKRYISTTEVEVAGHGAMVMFGGYSYLSLHNHPRINDRVTECLGKFGTGGHGVRLLAGTTSLHKELEEKIAAFKSTESAVTFSSGFVANFSTIGTLVDRHDTILSDQLNHASIINGCVLSGAKVKRFRHNDMGSLEDRLKESNSGKVLVVADAVFSMKGDIFNLPVASELCRKYGAFLMIDECHAIGVIGRSGRGIEEHFGLPNDSIDLKMGTFSKAIPSQGGYIASYGKMCDILRNRAGGYIYSGANTPANDAASLAALEIIEEEPWRVAQLQQNTKFAREELLSAGIPLGRSQTPVLPIVCGDDWLAFNLAKHCQDNGIFIQAVPYPVVPKGKAILRLAINTDHTERQISNLVQILVDGMRRSGMELSSPNLC